MSTLNSPQNRPRSKKITGGRVACSIYLPQEEVQEIDAIVDRTGMSRSSVIAKIYYQGKSIPQKNK